MITSDGELLTFLAGSLRTMKGSALPVLIALLHAGQAVSAEYLEIQTNCSDKSVLKGLKYLEGVGLVTRNGRYAWQIARGVAQFPLPLEELPEPVDKPVDNLADQAIEFERDPENFRVGNSPGPDSSSSSSRSINQESEESTTTSNAIDPEKFRVIQNLAALDEFQIYEPKRSLLAQMEHVAPEYIRWHCTHCGPLPANIGLAIYRMEHKRPTPPDAPHPTAIEPEYDPIPEGEDPPDEEALAWWAAIVAGLREQVPKVTFESIFPRGAPAWRAGDALEVHVPNRAFLEHVDAGELARLARQVSRGAVQAVRFVTE